jgi:membrane associated rhomboid family serine protease
MSDDQPSPRRIPIATFGFAALIVATSALQVARFGWTSDLSAVNLLGGTSLVALEHGEPWRTVTSSLLHLDPVHVVSNLIALLIIGTLVERSFGARVTLLVVLVSTIVGHVAGVVGYPQHIATGASAAVYGLLGFGLLQRSTSRASTVTIRAVSLAMVALDLRSLIDVGWSNLDKLDINLAAHAGGLIGGALVALMLRAPRTRALGIVLTATPILISVALIWTAVLVHERWVPSIDTFDAIEDGEAPLDTLEHAIRWQTLATGDTVLSARCIEPDEIGDFVACDVELRDDEGITTRQLRVDRSDAELRLVVSYAPSAADASAAVTDVELYGNPVDDSSCEQDRDGDDEFRCVGALAGYPFAAEASVVDDRWTIEVDEEHSAVLAAGVRGVPVPSGRLRLHDPQCRNYFPSIDPPTFLCTGTYLGRGQFVEVSFPSFGGDGFMSWSPDLPGRELPSTGGETAAILATLTYGYDFRPGSTTLTRATCEPAPPEPLRTWTCEARFADGSSGTIRPHFDGRGGMNLERSGGVGPSGPDGQRFDGPVDVPPDAFPGTLAARRLTPDLDVVERLLVDRRFVAGTRRTKVVATRARCDEPEPGDERLLGVTALPAGDEDDIGSSDMLASTFICQVDFDDDSTSLQRVDLMPGGEVFSSNLLAVTPSRLRTSVLDGD